MLKCIRQGYGWKVITLSFMLLLGLARESMPADTLIYVSMAPEKTIQSYRLDPTNGTLTSVEAVVVEGSPGALAVDPQKKFLYASLRSDSTLASYRIDSATGKLKPLNSVALPRGENAAFVRTDQTGRWLLSASYAAGKVVLHRLAADGTIESPAVQTVETAKTAHCVAIDRENRFVFVPHVAPNAIYQFHFDSDAGKLTGVANAPGGTEKAGPRHLAFPSHERFCFYFRRARKQHHRLRVRP